MNYIKSFINWTNAEALRAEGASDAFLKCLQEITHMRDNDIAETKELLNGYPEPSDTERAEWPPATRAYVENLEIIVDDTINNHS